MLTTTDVVADEAMFVDSKSEGASAGDSYNAPSYSSTPANAPKLGELNTDDELPF